MNKAFIREYLIVFKKEIRKVSVISLLCSVIMAIIMVFFTDKNYEVNSKVFVGKEKFIGENLIYNNEEVTFYQNLIATLREIAKSSELLNNALTESNSDLSLKELDRMLTVKEINKTQILEFRIVMKDPNVAYDILYNYIRGFVDTSKDFFKNSEIYVIEQPYVKIKSNGVNLITVTFSVFIVSILLGSLIIFIKENTFETIKEKSSLEGYTQLPCIGVIPNEL